MNAQRLFLPQLVILLLLVACNGESLPSTPALSVPGNPDSPPAFTVFTQNVYVGTNVDAVLAAPAEELPAAIGQALATFLATDWPARADAIAARIVSSRAEAVVLNELTNLTVTGFGGLLPELDVPFLPVLMQRIAAHGGNYQIAAMVANTDANLAVGPGTIRLRDFDAVLVRGGVPFELVAQQQFAARAPVNLGSLGSFDLIRGFVAVEVMSASGPVLVVGTHLEPVETSPLLQAAQAQELLGWLGGRGVATVVAGDINSAPTDPSPAAPYRQLLAAGFRDSWQERVGPRQDPGFTCCHDESLLNQQPTLVKRIDHVLVRSPRPGRGVISAELFGAEPTDRLPNGLWPADHAGILATMTFPGGTSALPVP